MRQRILFSDHETAAAFSRYAFTGRRMLCLLLCAALLFAAGCSPKESVSAPGESDGLLDLFVQQGAAPPEAGGTAAIPTPLPKKKDQLFREGIREVILNAVEQSNRLSALQLDQLLQNAQELDTTRSSETAMSFSLTGEEDTVVISQRLLYDAAQGTAALSAQLATGEETMDESAICFMDNAMLLQRADASKPLIRHPLSPEDFGSLSACSAYERAMRVLSSAQHKPSRAQWESAVDAYLTAIEPLMTEALVQENPEELVYANEILQGKRYVLSLTGRDAFTVYRGLIGLMQEDALFAGLFNSSRQNEAEEFLQTGIYQHAAELDALTEAEIAAFGLTFECEQTDTPTGIRVYASTGDRYASLRMLNFQQGELRENELSFLGFDGAGPTLTESRARAENGVGYEGYLNYTLTGAAGEAQESISMHMLEDLTPGGRTGQLTYDMLLCDLPDMENLTVSSALQYEEVRSDGGTALKAEGNLSLSSEGEETKDVSVIVQIDQRYGNVAIQPPVFLEGSGVDAPDLPSLLSALDMDTTPEGFANAPVSVRGLSIALLTVL